MKRYNSGPIVLILIFTISSVVLAQGFVAPRRTTLKRLDGSSLSTSEIEQTVTRLMREAHVTGLALAILNDNKVVYVKGFGFRNREEQKPLTENTVMYGASLTKAVFAYMVMQLVAEGVLDLDKPIYQYLPKPLPEYDKYKELASDQRYKLITTRMLLSHTSGFPNWRWINPDEKLNIKFTPGSRYAYSGEGINLAQFVIEAVTNKDVGEMMRDRIFKPFGMTRTSMTWQEQFKDDLAIGYDEKQQPLGHKQRTSARAAGSMDTTISDFARFMGAVMQGKGITKRMKEVMLTPQVQINSKTQFPTFSPETTDENSSIKLAYGLGWGLFQTPYGKAYFKEGHDDGWENHAVAFPDKQIAIVLMSNSSNGDSIFKVLLEALLKDEYTPWKWEGYTPYNF